MENKAMPIKGTGPSDPEMWNLIQSQIASMASKIDRLYDDRITRKDLDFYVQKNEYAAKHDYLEQRIKDNLEEIVTLKREMKENALSSKDNARMNLGLIMGSLGSIIAILGFILQHVKLS
jgi:hypothetical protein